jgi:hypothetical protein
MIGLASLGVALSASSPGSPVYCRLATSAHSFQQRFEDLQTRSLSTLERIVLSLTLDSDATGGRGLTRNDGAVDHRNYRAAHVADCGKDRSLAAAAL